MSKSPDAFRTISEVADWLGIQAHVLRFWESKFTQVKPVKRAGGRRYYRPSDMQLIGGIKKLLHDDGVTIKGVQKILREQGIGHVSDLSQPLEDGIEAIPLPDQQDATVLRFRANETRAIEPVNGVGAADAPPDPHQTADPVADTDPEPATEAAPDDAPEAPQLPLDDAPAAEPEPDPGVAADAPDAADSDDPAPQDTRPVQPTLPSFMHGGGMGAEPEVEAAPEETAGARAHSVEAPDPPAEQDLPYTPGILADIARLDRISADQARQLAPIVQTLQSWVDRAKATGVG